MTFVDTNAILDLFDPDPVWFDWSAARLTEAVVLGIAIVNPIVIAELSRNFSDVAEILTKLETLDVEVEPLDVGSAFTAGKRFQQSRRGREPGENNRVLPDFLIGAHALTLEVPLLTRDPRLYRRYSPT